MNYTTLLSVLLLLNAGCTFMQGASPIAGTYTRSGNNDDYYFVDTLVITPQTVGEENQFTIVKTTWIQQKDTRKRKPLRSYQGTYNPQTGIITTNDPQIVYRFEKTTGKLHINTIEFTRVGK
jgi:hypothetical protein